MNERQERPGADEYAEFYARYITRVPGGDIAAILEQQIGETTGLLDGLPDDIANFAYAPGKWTIKEVVGHVTDAERVLSYRALRFARADQTELAGFDENTYVPPGDFGRRSLADLLAEFVAVRRATVLLFRGMPAEAWTRRGIANKREVSVRALAAIIAGHELHHRELLLDRYLALMPGAPAS